MNRGQYTIGLALSRSLRRVLRAENYIIRILFNLQKLTQAMGPPQRGGGDATHSRKRKKTKGERECCSERAIVGASVRSSNVSMGVRPPFLQHKGNTVVTPLRVQRSAPAHTPSLTMPRLRSPGAGVRLHPEKAGREDPLGGGDRRPTRRLLGVHVCV